MNSIIIEKDLIVNNETGEVTQDITKAKMVKKQKTRPYVKLYVDDSIYDLIGLHTREMDVFLYCLKECDYGNKVILNKRRRDEIRALINFKTDGAVRNLISKVVKSGLLLKTEYRGEYEVNSIYFYKGRETQSSNLIKS
jgi:hypothetical protein